MADDKGVSGPDRPHAPQCKNASPAGGAPRAPHHGAPSAPHHGAPRAPHHGAPGDVLPSIADGLEPAELADGAAHIALDDESFRVELSGVIPHLRAFARSLSGSVDLADDLVQETLLKAWNARLRFEAGTNIRAWTFIILRNLFLSQIRRNRFRGEWDDATADRVLSAPAAQDKHVELSDLYRAMQQLPDAQREALILIGAGGFSYEEAAEISGVAVGTVKSRVARARAALEMLIESGHLPTRQSGDKGGSAAMGTLLGEVDRLAGD